MVWNNIFTYGLIIVAIGYLIYMSYANRRYTADKICELVNDKFAWVMKVDGKTICFATSDIADYFEQHYGMLGYKIIRDNHKWEEY